MSNREIVIDLIKKLPEDTPLQDIAREIELIAGIQTARGEAARGEGVTPDKARKLVDSWVSPVIITPTAIGDLEQIVRFIALNSPERARNFGHALIDHALSLAPFPEMGRVTPEVDDPSVREIVHGAYRIIYELRRAPSVIYVLRFWHAARGAPELPNG